VCELNRARTGPCCPQLGSVHCRKNPADPLTEDIKVKIKTLQPFIWSDLELNEDVLLQIGSCATRRVADAYTLRSATRPYPLRLRCEKLSLAFKGCHWNMMQVFPRSFTCSRGRKWQQHHRHDGDGSVVPRCELRPEDGSLTSSNPLPDAAG
jgi:hypothetical protein